MRLHHLLAAAALVAMTMPVLSQERGGRGSDAVRQKCAEEARLSVRPGRTARLDRDQIREMRREYTRDCVRKARS